MEKLEFTIQRAVNDIRTYPGFKRFRSPNQIPDHFDISKTRLIIAWFDGEPELWVVENTLDAVASLARYYTDEGWEGRVTYQEFTWQATVDPVAHFGPVGK